MNLLVSIHRAASGVAHKADLGTFFTVLTKGGTLLAVCGWTLAISDVAARQLASPRPSVAPVLR